MHVVSGEMRAQGVRLTQRCFWDDKVDNVATETFKNVRGLEDSLSFFRILAFSWRLSMEYFIINRRAWSIIAFENLLIASV